MRKVGEEIPLTTKSAIKVLGLHENGIIQYVVCPMCHSVYEHEDCVTTLRNGDKEPKPCSHIRYPSHPHTSKRKPCNTMLLKSVQNRLVPLLSYPYYPLHLALQRLASRPGFLSSCEKWRERESTIPSEYFGDVYDGLVWKKFRHSFLSAPYSYLLTLNVDWFQPFKHTQYSVGAIYLIIQNLPREERFKEENVLLIGVMPGPKEPHLSIDPYLSPLIEELNKSYLEGIDVTSHNGISVKIRVLLSCVTCDIPATRKVCGFPGHNARLGCNKCYKQFNVASKPVDFSGYDRSTWEPRSASKHRSDCLKVERCVTKTAVQEMVSELGVRPCALLKLPYYNPIEFVAIDVMHNIFLGTAKHMFCVWIEKGLLSKHHLSVIDKMTSQFLVPSNTGRLPLNVSSNYLSFKADQWSSWTTIYSPVVLKSILPDDHYRCWLVFVRASAILTQRILTSSDIDTADRLLLIFCKKVEELYGYECCTPNMHLHLHLKETLLDFGPAHATWCYSFERYNGMLGSMPTNKKSIEIQFMRTFLRNQTIHSKTSVIDDDDFKEVLIRPTKVPQVSLSCTSDSELLNLLKLSHGPLQQYPFSYSDSASVSGLIHLLDSRKELIFTSLEITEVTELYKQLNPGCTIEYVSPFYDCHGRVSIGGDILGSMLHGRSAQSSSVIQAYWPSFGNDITAFDHSRANVGKVQYYFHHTVTISENQSELSKIVHYTFAFVHWMEYHHHNSTYGISATVCANSTKQASLCSIIPVLRISAKCATCVTTLTLSTRETHICVFRHSPASCSISLACLMIEKSFFHHFEA